MKLNTAFLPHICRNDRREKILRFSKNKVNFKEPQKRLVFAGLPALETNSQKQTRHRTLPKVQ
jgi:hypothetical protein